MKQSAVIINRTVECNNIEVSDLRDEVLKISGKAAALYHTPEGFNENDLSSLEKRAMEEASNGNYNVFEHSYVTFLLNTSKVMAMVLKSMNFYNATEKSARRTTLNIETDIEKEKYDKWKAIFTNLIGSYYNDYYNDEEINQLAMENARYMTSIFTPTEIEYTIPFGRAVMLSKWLKELSVLMGGVNADVNEHDADTTYNWIYARFAEECGELSRVIGDAIGVYQFDDVIVDKLNNGIEFFRVANYIIKTKDIIANDKDLDLDISNLYKDSIKEDFYSDCYISNYKASFVAVSQTENHRALHYSIDIPIYSVEPYIPKIIRGSGYEVAWRNDFHELVDLHILPQATLLEVSESGRFEDFYIKCKERLCTKSQLEIVEITRDQVVKFAGCSSNLSNMNQILLGNMIRKGPGVNWKKPATVIVESRCKFADYKCDDPCSIINDSINYFRNI